MDSRPVQTSKFWYDFDFDVEIKIEIVQILLYRKTEFIIKLRIVDHIKSKC